MLDEAAQGLDQAGEARFYRLIDEIRARARLRRADGQPRPARGDGGVGPGHLPERPCLLRGHADGGLGRARVPGAVRPRHPRARWRSIATTTTIARARRTTTTHARTQRRDPRRFPAAGGAGRGRRGGWRPGRSAASWSGGGWPISATRPRMRRCSASRWRWRAALPVVARRRGRGAGDGADRRRLRRAQLCGRHAARRRLARRRWRRGIVALSFLPGVRVDLIGYLFGDILAVTRGDLAGDLGRRGARLRCWSPGAGGGCCSRRSTRTWPPPPASTPRASG